VILDDAAAATVFSADAYVQQRRPPVRALPPLVKQAKLTGALYLENNLTPHAFTSGASRCWNCWPRRRHLSGERRPVFRSAAGKHRSQAPPKRSCDAARPSLAEGQKIQPHRQLGRNISHGKARLSRNTTGSSGSIQGRGADASIILGKDSSRGSFSCSATSNGAIRERSGFELEFRNRPPRWELLSISTEWVAPC